MSETQGSPTFLTQIDEEVPGCGCECECPELAVGDGLCLRCKHGLCGDNDE